MILQKTKKLGRLSILNPRERRAVLEFTRLLRKRFGSLIKEVILFGSKVRGTCKYRKYNIERRF